MLSICYQVISSLYAGSTSNEVEHIWYDIFEKSDWNFEIIAQMIIFGVGFYCTNSHNKKVIFLFSGFMLVRVYSIVQN